MGRSRTAWMIAIGLLTVTALAPLASAHEHYHTEDDRYELVVGEQGEPVYTYDWTGLDLIVRSNETGGPVPGVQHTVDATLIAPDGTEMSKPLETQFGERGRYEFTEGYVLTQPGQYQLRLEGHINGSSVNGTYDMPGPRKAWGAVSFPNKGIPGILQLQQDQADLDNRTAQLEQRVDDLQGKVDSLESKVANMEQGQQDQGDGVATAGFEAAAAIAAAGIAYAIGRRQAS